MHLGHKNVLKFDARQYERVEEMNEALIANWNTKVSDEDDVWILGDFCYRSDKDPSFYLKQLKGRKHLIMDAMLASIQELLKLSDEQLSALTADFESRLPEYLRHALHRGESAA